MKKYFTIAPLLFLTIGLISCSNEKPETQNETASKLSIPVLDRTISDIDGNSYKIVTVGSQTWTKSNLNVSRYRNGDPIPQITDPTEWANLTTGAWCYYENNTANGTVYGKLYNWYAVNDPRGLAPEGWHIPSDTEWNTLVSYLDNNVRLFDIIQSVTAGGKMKQTGTTYWDSPNENASNSSGFTALPAGARVFYGSFSSIGIDGYWWSASQNDASTALIHYVWYNRGWVYKYFHNKNNAISVRCIKN